MARTGRSLPCSLLVLYIQTCLAERGDVELIVGHRAQPLRKRRHCTSAVLEKGAGRSSLELGANTLDDPCPDDDQSEAQEASDACSEGGSTWNTKAGEYTCGQRIEFLMDKEGKTLEEAREKVRQDFPQECSACGEAADGAPASKASEGSGEGPSPGPASDAELKVGAGFMLAKQKQPLDPKVAAKKLAELGVRTARMWNYNTDYLEALLEAGIKDVLADVPNYELPEVANGGGAAKVADALKSFHEKGMKFRVGVGNEPLAKYENNRWTEYLAPAMEKLLEAFKSRGMDDVTVAVPFHAGVFGKTYPPETGEFNGKLVETISEVAKIVHREGGDFFIHLYPYFSFVGAHGEVPLDLALGTKGNGKYSCLLHQSVVATRAALIKLDSAYETMPLSIGETGWPSAGAEHASVENLCAYAKSTIEHVKSTDQPMDKYLRSVYFMEAFDEGNKAAAGDGGGRHETENHFGLMEESGKLKCDGLKIN